MMAKSNTLRVVDDESRWIARKLPGGIYCAPRCGCGCTMAAYEKANEESAAVVARLGKGWQARVWENCGWHWEVSSGENMGDLVERVGISIRPGYGENYSVTFDLPNVGNVGTQFTAHGDSLEDAIGNLRQHDCAIAKPI